jgi:hypothetical protein
MEKVEIIGNKYNVLKFKLDEDKFQIMFNFGENTNINKIRKDGLIFKDFCEHLTDHEYLNKQIPDYFRDKKIYCFSDDGKYRILFCCEDGIYDIFTISEFIKLKVSILSDQKTEITSDENDYLTERTGLNVGKFCYYDCEWYYNHNHIIICVN